MPRLFRELTPEETETLETAQIEAADAARFANSHPLNTGAAAEAQTLEAAYFLLLAEFDQI